MGRADLIGNGKHHLIPSYQPLTDGSYQSARRKNSSSAALPHAKPTVAAKAAPAKTAGGRMAPQTPAKGRLLTQHTGLPPRVTGSAKPQAGKKPR